MCPLTKNVQGETLRRMAVVNILNDNRLEQTKPFFGYVYCVFICLPYITDDPVACLKLVDAGATAVMPLAAPIGSGLGIRNPFNLRIILEQVQFDAGVPVIVDAGVGTASDAAKAMEMGVAGVLMNTAIAGATDPQQMALAMKAGVLAGRLAYQAGRMPQKLYATASSPLQGMIS